MTPDDAFMWYGKNPELPWPDPSPDMLEDPAFEAIWQTIKSWDINVPEVYNGYCGATGNHVRAILDALSACMRREMDGVKARLNVDPENK